MLYVLSTIHWPFTLTLPFSNNLQSNATPKYFSSTWKERKLKQSESGRQASVESFWIPGLGVRTLTLFGNGQTTWATLFLLLIIKQRLNTWPQHHCLHICLQFGCCCYDCPPHIKYFKHFIYVCSRSGMSIKWMRGPNHCITVWYMSKIYALTSKLGQGYCDDSGVRTQSYDCPPHIKYVKHLLYVWSGSGMSMQGMGGPNHIPQHVPSENPTQNPTTATGPPPFRVMVWYGVVAIWLPTMIEGIYTLSIGMK
jgi:hypothetical protein